MSVYPYKFVPIYKERIWGGSSLARLFGRVLPGKGIVGESWELADLPEGESVVANGPDAGKTLHWLMAAKGGEILGPARAAPGGRFPLLLKLLDANDILSLQVHPDEQAAGELGPPARFKTECWYVVESRGGYILKGLKGGVTPPQFRQAVRQDGDLKELIQRVDVSAGDFHYLPAGVVHALGPGVVVAEVQTPSDTTYRVSDWGRGREIHVAEALKCIRFDQPAPPPAKTPGKVLLRTPCFVVSRLALKVGQRKLAVRTPVAWMVLKGRGRVVQQGGGPATEVGPGDTLLVPAGLQKPIAVVEQDLAGLEIAFP